MQGAVLAMTNMTVLFSTCLFVLLSTIMINSAGFFADAKPVTSTSASAGSALPLNSTTAVFPQGTSFRMVRKLYSRTKMFLQIDMNGLVSGTSNCSSKYAQLELLSVGRDGLKRIKGVASGRYLAMNNKGIVYSTKQASGEDTLFVEKVISSTSYHTFASAKYFRKVLHDTFVAIKRNGRIKPGRLTNKLQKPTHFLILPAVSNTC